MSKKKIGNDEEVKVKDVKPVTYWTCFSCGLETMRESENGIVCECENCGYWHYSDS